MTIASAAAWVEKNLAGQEGQCRSSAAEAFGTPAVGGAHAVRHYGSDQTPADKVDVSVIPVNAPARVLAWLTSHGKDCGGFSSVATEKVAGRPAVLGEVPCDQGSCYVLVAAGAEGLVQAAVTISYDSRLTLDAVRAGVAQVLGP
jgi:hypothetical protein